jgi:hypothetical protein
MRTRTWLVTALTLLATLGTFSRSLASSTIPTQPAAQPQAAPPAQDDALRALDGEWIFLEDRTEGQPLERLGSPMASKFSMRVEEGAQVPAVILNGHGSGHKDVRIALDGSITEVPEDQRIVRYRGQWKDGTFEYEVRFERDPGTSGLELIRRSFRPTDEGLRVGVTVDSGTEQVGLYRHAEDIPLPTPFKATIADLAWLAGAWVGTRGEGNATSIEERWSPPAGGAMLAIARSVRAEKMRTFEFLRIVEIDGGLVYKAQPGGAPPTEFTLTELTKTEEGAARAVFDNPRHDYPKRIVYELSPDGRLTATTGNMKGGTPRRLDFTREGN